MPAEESLTGIITASVPTDQPLRGRPHPRDSWHPELYLAEFIGTGLLVFVGLSIVIALWAEGGPLLGLPIGPVARRVVTGLLFGGVGATIAFSPLGRISGAHINPAMTLAFWFHGKILWREAASYMLAQLLGGIVGTAGLLLWGQVGKRYHYAASLPGLHDGLLLPLCGETIATFLLVTLVFVMASHDVTKRFTPLVNPPLFAALNWLEAPLSGASANPARSFGPALFSGDWPGWWIYFLGPALGAVLAITILRLELFGRHRPEEARVAHPPRPEATNERNRHPA